MKEQLYTYEAICVRVISGDTIEVMIDLGFNTWTKKKVKLFGIAAPRINAKNPEEKENALKSKNRLQELLLEEDFLVESLSLNKCERSMANIYCHGHHINQQMIDEEYAIEYPLG